MIKNIGLQWLIYTIVLILSYYLIHLYIIYKFKKFKLYSNGKSYLLSNPPDYYASSNLPEPFSFKK